MRFEVILFVTYTNREDLNIIMVSSTCVKLKRHRTWTSLTNLIQNGFMYCKILWWSGSTSIIPTFFWVRRKPHLFGNKSCTISCCFICILWRTQIVEGKYCPQKLSQQEYTKFGSTVILMLRVCELIPGIVNTVVWGSAFLWKHYYQDRTKSCLCRRSYQ